MMAGQATHSPIRVLALMEATTVGGPSKNLLQIGMRGAAAAVEGRGVELSIATFQRGADTEPSPFVAAARQAGLGVHVLTEERRFDLGPLRQLRRLVETSQPDILQTHNIKSHLFVRLLGLHHKYPWVVFQHGYTNTDLKDRIYNQVDRWTLRAADRVVAVCEAFAARLEGRGIERRRIRVQHNSVRPFVAPAPEEVASLRARHGVTNELLILAVGRLSLEKGHADLLRAMARLRGQRWKLAMVGEGPERSRLEALREELGLREQVIFAGHQNETQSYYGAADLLVLPSHTEGSPNVVLEAMAAGVPMVACAVGGVPEILRHEETGLLVPARDEAAMAGQVSRLLADESLRGRLGAAARREAGRYTPERQYGTLVDLYQELLREGGR